MKVTMSVVSFLGLFSLLSTPVLGETGVSSERLRGTNKRNNFENAGDRNRALNPIYCGCTGCDREALSTMAGAYSCGDRINWLRSSQQQSERDACIQVAGREFTTQCAVCNPENCDNTPLPPIPPPTPSPISISPLQDNKCGCNECDDVWNTFAGEFKCGQRINWLQSKSSVIAGGPYEEAVACSMVASDEYPIECGKCDPSKCNSNNEVVTDSPTKTPTNSPTLRPTVSPTASPTNEPTMSPTKTPTQPPSKNPTKSPTRTPTRTPISIPTPSPVDIIDVDDETTNVCGCPTCVDSIWNTFAGEFKCGNRIEYLQNSLGFNEQDACSLVAGTEFPVECGGCDPDRCVELEPNFNNNINNNNNPSSGEQKCGGAVNSSGDSNQVCRNDLWDPTGDSSMYCFAYGGSGDPCHLSNNNDPNDGLYKNPAMCSGDTLYLWDEPDTQGRSYDWSGREWLEYSRRFSNELKEIRSTRGFKVTAPMLKAGGPGALLSNLKAFYDACGAPCSDKNDPAYIDLIAINAFCGDFNGPAGCRGGAAFIYNEAIATSRAYQNIPVYITNWSRLQTANPQDQVEAIDAIEEFFPSTIEADADRIVQRVYWFGATDYGGGSSNNFLTNVLPNGQTLGELWRNKCESL